MTRHSVDSGYDNMLQELVLAVEPEPEAESEDIDRSVRQLRAELTDLDVESVARLASENTPVGAKGDAFSLCTVLVTLTAAGGVLPILIETVRDWLARNAIAQRISVTIDGDTLVLEKGTTQERHALIEAYLHRHEVL
jgi:hypothetical protein